jgi:hypothetical protein
LSWFRDGGSDQPLAGAVDGGSAAEQVAVADAEFMQDALQLPGPVTTLIRGGRGG